MRSWEGLRREGVEFGFNIELSWFTVTYTLCIGTYIPTIVYTHMLICNYRWW